MTIDLLAPAKVNLGLEVIRRRSDGYHDIATVFQTISLFDRMRLEASQVDEVRIVNRQVQLENNLAERALQLARTTGLTSRHWRVEIEKRIPVSAGLGGGSADAAAVLTGLAAHAGTSVESLSRTSLSLGSDVPFLLNGGAALAHGRGDVLSPVRTLRGCWLVLATPPFELERKTARLYGALTPAEFSDGSRVERVAAALESEAIPPALCLVNAFEEPLYELIPRLLDLRRAFMTAGAPVVALTGAGPTHYTLVPALTSAIDLARELRRALPATTRILIARPIGSGPIYRGKTPLGGGTL
jgi:4-diphosphocytidyl-2-C-methyl-D-erythritol kinase